MDENERLSKEDFEQMWKEQKRRSLEHIPFEYLLQLLEMNDELLFDENIRECSDEKGRLFLLESRKRRLETKYEEIRWMFEQKFQRHWRKKLGQPQNLEEEEFLTDEEEGGE